MADNDDVPSTEETEPETEPTSESTSENDTEDEDDGLDAFSSFLKSRGVRDGKTLIFENDEGETNEVDFSSLSKKEQLAVLESLTDPGLSADEIETISLMRKHNKSLPELIAIYQEKAIEDYKNQNNITPVYSVDDYNDDELYLADLKLKYADMTEEELQSELEIAKSNEEIFKKKVDTIRKQYKAQEDNQLKEQEEQEKAQREAYQNTFVEALRGFDSVSLDYKDPKSDEVEISDDERSAIYDYVFRHNPDGITKFVEDLSKPEVIVQLAWYRLFGKDTISDISNYWKDQLVASRRTNTPEKKTNVTVQSKTETTDKNPHAMWDKLL